MPERELVLEPVRRTGQDRGLTRGLQLAASTLGAKVLNAGRVRAQGRFDLPPVFLPLRTEKYPSFYPLTPAAAGIGVWGQGPAFEVPFSAPALH